MLSLLDFATRTAAELVGVAGPAQQLLAYEAAWSAKASESCDRAALRVVLQELAESTGRHLRGAFSSFEQFKQVRLALCQWHNGPVELMT